MNGVEKWGAILGIAGTFVASGATIVARFNTLENAKERMLDEVVALKQQTAALDSRVRALEVEKDTLRDVAAIRQDVEVLKVRVDSVYGASRKRNWE